MTLIKGIEGDYIETKKGNLYFDVKGLLHPDDKKIAFLRFFPDPKGDRVKNGKKFSKIYDIDKRYSFLRENFPEYLFFSKELDIEIQGIKNEDIKKIYSPIEYLKELFNKTNLIPIEEHSLNLCELFIKEGAVHKDSIGITGSSMIGLNNQDSDIDLIIYGTEQSLEFQNRIKDIFSTSKECRQYTFEEYKNHYYNRFNGSSITFVEFLKSEKKKLHQGQYKNIDFFIRYIKSPKDWQGNFYDFLYKNYGRIKLKAEIIDSTYSIFTPCIYTIKVKKILERNIIVENDRKKNIVEVSSFRGRYCEQAIQGDKVLIEGKLEKVTYKKSKEYYRILLTNQRQDKMTLIN